MKTDELLRVQTGFKVFNAFPNHVRLVSDVKTNEAVGGLDP